VRPRRSGDSGWRRASLRRASLFNHRDHLCPTMLSSNRNGRRLLAKTVLLLGCCRPSEPTFQAVLFPVIQAFWPMSAQHEKSPDSADTHFIRAFSQVFRQAQEEAASEARSRKTIATADATEVARVLGARSDYDCLQVIIASPGSVGVQRRCSAVHTSGMAMLVRRHAMQVPAAEHIVSLLSLAPPLGIAHSFDRVCITELITGSCPLWLPPSSFHGRCPLWMAA